MSRIIAIISGKGGVGKTTFSANIAIALSMLGKKTVVIDCNVTTPHLSYYIGAKEFSTTLNNVFAGDVDVKFAPLEKNGVMFIPASNDFFDLKKVDMRGLKGIVDSLSAKEDFDFIILDSAPGLGREAMGVLHACQEIIFITNPTVPNVVDVVKCKDVAKLIGHKSFCIVMNMVRGKDYEILPEKAEELFEIPVIGSIPFDEKIMDSTAQGVPILWYDKKSKSYSSFLEIATNVIAMGDSDDDIIPIVEKMKNSEKTSITQKLKGMLSKQSD